MKRLLEVSKGGLLLGATRPGAEPLRAGVNFIKSGKGMEQERKREGGGWLVGAEK